MLSKPVQAMLILLLSVSASPAQDKPEALALRIGKIAARFSSLDVPDALYDSVPALRKELEPLRESLHELADKAQGEEVRTLLHHKDARVRTLGIVLGFRECRLDLLPDIALLTADSAMTFPEQARWHQQAFDRKPIPLESVDVKRYAIAVIDAYLGHSDELRTLERAHRLPLREPAEPVPLAAAMQEFVSKRDNRLSSSGLLVAMDQATGRISPRQADRRERIEAVMNNLGSIPMPRRFFVALALEYDRYKLENFTPDLLLALAREVPRAARMAAIQGKRPVDDPDLPPGASADYILDHAADLLLVSDVELLLQRAKEAEKPTPSRFYAAAADLAPARADDILIPAFGQFGKEHQDRDRARVAISLARHGTERGLKEAVDWFFRELPQSGAYGFGREAFLSGLHAADPVRSRKIAARITRDPRLPTLGPASTRILILAVQGYLGRELASEEDVRESYGIDEAQSRKKFSGLARWQKLLADTVKEWDG